MNIQTPPSPVEIETVLGLDRRSRQRRRLGRILWMAIALLAAAGPAWWYFQAQSQTSAMTYETAPAARADLVVAVTATGKIQPITQVDVSSELSGVVRTVKVDDNSAIKRGDILAELDITRLKAQLKREEANVASAKAKLADANATMEQRLQAFTRLSALNKEGISASQDLESAKADHDRAVAAIEAAKAEIAMAMADIALTETDLEKAQITSPIDGIVLKRSVEPGQTVASSLQVPVLFTLAEDLKRMQVEADVDEADIGQVKEGQSASFTVDAYPGQQFPAKIESIRFSPDVTDNVVTYKAVLSVDNSKLLLRPGMTVTARIVVKEIPQALTVSNAVLRYVPPVAKPSSGFSITSLFLPRMPRPEKTTSNGATSGERTLWVLENGEARQVSVKAGASDGKITEILGGELTEGTETIVSARRSGS